MSGNEGNSSQIDGQCGRALSLVVAPLTCPVCRLAEALKEAASLLRTKPKQLVKSYVMGFVFSYYTVRGFTLAHPFLLADNRFVTQPLHHAISPSLHAGGFYAWRSRLKCVPKSILITACNERPRQSAHPYEMNILHSKVFLIEVFVQAQATQGLQAGHAV